MSRPRALSAALAAVAALSIAGCGGDGSGESTQSLPQGSESVSLDPSGFTTAIDNPYWPMKPGTRWVYTETDSEGAKLRIDVTVSDRTKRMADGIEARVVHDLATDEKGRPVEDTYDWYAQDADGNIWYLGEDTKEFENGKVVSTAGSWEAGVDGAEPGIAIPAHPEPGLAYRQEYYAGKAEDNGEIISVDEQAEVPAGHYSPVVMTKDTTPVEPKVLEFKFYAEGVGPVLELTASGGSDRAELVSFRPGR
jgi:hypothetical protein